jgi:hypothetical protein
MVGNPIIIGEFSILKRTMVGVRTPIEREVRGSHTLPTRDQVDLTPSNMIAGVAAPLQTKKDLRLCGD